MADTSIPAEVEAEHEARAHTALVESVLDNLPIWTVIAAAIGLLYLVWATIEILSRYVGAIPSLTP